VRKTEVVLYLYLHSLSAVLAANNSNIQVEDEQTERESAHREEGETRGTSPSSE
jgi:hypothetical protein